MLMISDGQPYAQGYKGEIAKADAALLEAHNLQTQFLAQEAGGTKTEITALFVHSQDHLMTCMLAIDLIKEMIEIIYFETKLFIQNSFNFRKLAIEEMKNYSSKVFIQKAKDMVKNIGNDFKPIPAGIRAQLLNTKTNELVQDFVIEHGVNSTHILNAVSPAFTCSFAFAKYVVNEINQNKKEDKNVK